MGTELERSDRRSVLLAAWVAWLGGRPNDTVSARLADLRALARFAELELEPRDLALQLAGEIPVRVVALVAAWSTEQASSGLRGTTIARRISTVSSWFAHLATHQLAAPLVLSRPAVATYQRGACPPRTSVELAIADLARSDRRLELAALLVLADCGLRESEAAALQVDDLLAGPPPAISVVRKGGTRVTRRLSPRAYATIVAALEGRTCGPLLATPRGRAYTAKTLAALTHALELGPPHGLRRSGATELYHRTHDAEIVRDWLGHANLSSTQRYVFGLSDSGSEGTSILAGE